MKTTSRSYQVLKNLIKFLDSYEKSQEFSRNPNIKELELTVRSLNLQRMP
jgi:hypothetical protein